MMPDSAIKGLGEIALRVKNLDAMQRFYEDVIGLRLLKRFEKAAFFKIADGFAGHTQVLTLFDRTGDSGADQPEAARSTVDHLAFEIALADYEAERQRLMRHGLTVETTAHTWMGWRSLYVLDPEGNQVELVCYDESASDNA